MVTVVTLLTPLGILFGIADFACGRARAFVARIGGADMAPVDSKALGVWRVGTRLRLVLSCSCVLAAIGDAGAEAQALEGASSTPTPASWGALWVYILALLVEWSRSGLEVAVRRAVVGALLAGVGVLLVGLCLTTVWTNCTGGSLAIDAGTSAAAGAVAALGLTLIPLAGIALRLAEPAVPLLSSGAAGVVMAMWLQPTLPSLGCLPVSHFAGGPLAAILVAAPMLLGWMAARGPRMTGAGIVLYMVLSVGGSYVLGILPT